MTVNPARLTPGEVGIIEWTRLRAGSGIVTLAADFYEWFFDTERGGAPDRTADRIRGATRAPAPARCDRRHPRAEGHPRPWVNFGAPAFRMNMRLRDFAFAGPTLRNTLRAAFGAQWTVEIESAWQIAFNVGVAALLSGSFRGSDTEELRDIA